MTSTLMRRSVTVIAWSAYRIEVEARSDDEAIALAELAYEEDFDRFSHRDGGISDIFVDLSIGED